MKSFLPAAAAGSEGMERLLGFDMQLIFDSVLTGLAVFVLFVLLSYLLFDPVKDFLAKRQEKIRTDLATAKQDKEDAAALKADYDSRIKVINKEAEEILSDARKKALKREAEIIAEAKEEAKRIMDRAQAEIVLERKKALDDMKLQMISVASLMAGRVIGESMTLDIQEGLLEETLKEIGDQTWQS